MSVNRYLNIPVVHGSIQEFGNTKVLLAKNYQNEILFRGEIIKYPTNDQLKDCRKIRVIDEHQAVDNIYLKINTIVVDNESFNSLNLERLSPDYFLNYVMRHQGMDKLLDLMMKHMYVSVSYQDKNQNKSYINQELTRTQILKVVSEIELNKSNWIKEANEKGHWVKKVIHLDGSIKVIIEVFPDTRSKKDVLGQIDIRMKHVGKGSFKKVYESYNYQTSKVTAGLYAKNVPSVLQGIEIEKYLRNELSKEENKPSKRYFVLSKAIDSRPVEKGNVKYERIKFTQTFFLRGDFFDVLANGDTKLGETYTFKQYKQAYTDMLKGLEFLKKVNVLHRDLKPENLLVGSNGVKMGDWDLAVVGEGENRCGSKPYIAPEILAGMPASHRSDLYGLGKSMNPFQIDPWWVEDGFIDANTLQVYRVEEIPAYEQPKPSTLKWFHWKMTHTDENRRFESASEALRVLEALPDTNETDFKTALWLEDTDLQGYLEDEDLPALENVEEDGDLPALENVDDLEISNGIKALTLSEDVIGKSTKRTIDSKIMQSSSYSDIYQAKRARDDAVIA